MINVVKLEEREIDVEADVDTSGHINMTADEQMVYGSALKMARSAYLLAVKNPDKRYSVFIANDASESFVAENSDKVRPTLLGATLLYTITIDEILEQNRTDKDTAAKLITAARYPENAEASLRTELQNIENDDEAMDEAEDLVHSELDVFYATKKRGAV